MTIEPPLPGEPRRPHGPRNAGDAWVVAPTGQRYWGRFGAAGLLALDPQRGVLLQHRVAWSHFGDTWGLPGGARHEGESSRDGALREAGEEAGVPSGAIRARMESLFDLGYWSYATLVGDVIDPFEATISDPESRELAWVPIDEVDSYPLHPGFEASWPRLRSLLAVRPTIIVDAANVVGSVPDGWWRDRAGAASRLLSAVAGLVADGVDGADLGIDRADATPLERWYPEWTVVIEGAARSAADVDGVEIVRAEGSGDDAIVEATARARAAGRAVTVVTSDRGLRQRVEALGAGTAPVSWLTDRT